ncbi:MAG: GTPase ObgE [Bacteroidota bacterium]|jgi:GTP-binding protein|nr:GTPase ObgE [Bacteroidota bacterium]MEC7851414.1 GTPase ObgE [Bacteroidota bacterium]MEC8702180.1 GTPase ObgE [Bacteroidota bacterium]|tara:strand:+ start:3433 stop:4422 length:990 start_codon:yes stop_codon:yes gene_type:complete
MSNPNFIDHIKIFCKSGNGGRGSSSFRREKFVPKGGPDGGDGGKGGDIILKGNSQLWTLLHLRYTKHLKAENGEGGQGSKKHGKNGKDVVIEVPLGTIAKSADNDNISIEILNHNEEKILLEGGIGGLGNVHFKTSTKQAPQYSQPGIQGIEEWINLELKVLADVGLVGFPNAGKSTLLSSISKAKPKIGDYPFTTLTPNLGVIPYKDNLSFIMADIPGIIEGASEGKGLGIRFLRHIERNSILLFMIPVTSEVDKEFKLLHKELKSYNKELLEKKIIIAVTKCDLLSEKELKEMKFNLKQEIIKISSVTGYGLENLKDAIWKKINLNN